MPEVVDALLLGVNRVVLGRLAHQHVAVFVDGEPVEGRVDVLQDEAVFADVDEGVRGLVGVLVVGVEAAGAALHGDARLDVHAAAAAARASGIDAFDGDLCAFATVGRWVDRHPGGDGAGGYLLPVSAVGQDLDSVIDERGEIAVALGDGDLDDAVVESPAVAVVGEGDRGVHGDLLDLRQCMGSRLCRCAG